MNIQRCAIYRLLSGSFYFIEEIEPIFCVPGQVYKLNAMETLENRHDL